MGDDSGAREQGGVLGDEFGRDNVIAGALIEAPDIGKSVGRTVHHQ
jgi:hypothetical protein